MFGGVAALNLKMRPFFFFFFGSEGFESAPSAEGNKTNGPNSNKLLRG